MPRTRAARQVTRRGGCSDVAPRTRRSTRLQDRPNFQDLTQDSDVVILDESIDLTSVANEDFVDLTSPTTNVPIDLTSSVTDDLGATRITDSPNRSLGANDHSVITNHFDHGQVIETQDADDSLPSLEPVHSPPRVDGIRDTVESVNSSQSRERPKLAALHRLAAVHIRAARPNDIYSPESAISCPVCLDGQKTIKQSNRKLVSTKCGHVFCNVCIYKAFDAFKACPVCRKKQQKADLRVLHI